MRTHAHTQRFFCSLVWPLLVIDHSLLWQFTQKPPGVSVLITNLFCLDQRNLAFEIPLL